MDKNELRPIKIKTGVLKRSVKDYQYYVKELNKTLEKVETMKAENKDEHDIKQYQQVAEESQQMIPQCKTKIEGALDDLKSVVEPHAENQDYLESEEGKAAAEQIGIAVEFLASLE